MKKCGQPNCFNPDSCSYPKCKHKTIGDYKAYWNNFNTDIYQEYLEKKQRFKKERLN